MLRSVVSAMAANMMLVQCNSGVPISLACLMVIGNSPDHGIIGTASLGGPPEPAVRQATLGRSSRQAAWGTVISNRKSVSSSHMRCRIIPMRRARATMARFAPRRRVTCAAHVLSHVERPPVHHDGYSLTQRAAKVDITGLGDAARDIAFARLVS